MSARPEILLVETTAHDFGSVAPAPPIAAAAEALATGGVVIVRVLPTAALKTEAIAGARAALEAIRIALVGKHELPDDAYVEVDEESLGVPVAPFHQRRFLLPHQDGGHCSFLTPSRVDCPDVRPDDRMFSTTVYWRRASHKLFQGFLVTNPGEPVGETYYYDALALLQEAFAHQRGRAPANVAELAGFGLANLRRSRELCVIHGSRYFTPGAFLGSPDPAHHVLPSGPRAESRFWPAQYVALPQLFAYSEACPCGACLGPGHRLLCHAMTATLGSAWPQVRNRHEAVVAAERHDLVLANNLTLYHGADSDASRTLVPMCLVLDRADGSVYERWLAAQWRLTGLTAAAGATVP